MIVQPKTKGFICITAHPTGCARNIQEQIDYVVKRGPVKGGPKKALIIGASTGYGMATRITAAFGSGAATLGVFFERPSEGDRTATAGWYNTVAFEKAALAKGLYAKSINGDAFTDEVKEQAAQLIKKDLGQVDLVVYTLAAPRRVHPKTGEVFKSVLKPTGKTYKNKSLNFDTNEVVEITIEPATADDVRQTVGVMGGEDWEMWIDFLKAQNLLAPKALTVAYSYIGPKVTQTIYRKGTIGAAKDHLEKTAHKLDKKMSQINGRAIISVNKAILTQASSAIPFNPLYVVLLLRVMKAKGINEGCIEQIDRLFRDRLFNDRLWSAIPVDAEGRIRVDDWEMREDVQKEVEKLWREVSTGNVTMIGDVEGYKAEFMKLFGFGLEGVDYNADVEIDLSLNKV
jgi:enoyl-[acyl-carrier protein] reductase / trans-2-enoyl-CoA reductase (NAD+)